MWVAPTKTDTKKKPTGFVKIATAISAAFAAKALFYSTTAWKSINIKGMVATDNTCETSANSAAGVESSP